MQLLHDRMLMLIVFLLSKATFLSAQAFQWVSTPSSTGSVTVNGVTVDGNGNIYVVGSYDGTATIGSVTLTSIDASSGLNDIFIAKYNSTGTALWAKKAGSDGDDLGNAICVDDSGYCYITGTISDTATFGSITLNNAKGTAFVAKYKPNGAAKWAINVRTPHSTGSSAIAVDDNKVCIAGWFYVEAYVGLDTLSDGDTDPMLAAFNSHTGAELWGRQAGEYLGVEEAYDVAIDGSGHVYYCGHFYYTSYFSSDGTLAHPPMTITANGSPDFFIATYTDGGGLMNVIHADGASVAQAKALEVDAVGNVYCAGIFNDTLTVGSAEVGSFGHYDIFVLKLNSSGVPLWMTSAGNISCSCADDVNGLALDAAGNCYITGTFFSFDDWRTAFGSDTLSGFYSNDIYVAKLNSSGAFLWAEAAGGYGIYGDSGNDLVEDGSGNVYVSGSLDCNFGNVGYFSQVSYSPGGNAGFLGKINNDLHAGSVVTSACTGNAISVPYTTEITFSTGNVFTAQLSDINGYFNSPVTIGTKTAKTSGTITATIPSSTAPGSKYRIRVIASSPARTGSDNGSDITVAASPDATVTPSGPTTVCKPSTVDLSITSCDGCLYQWYKGSAAQPGATTSSYSASKTGSYKVTITNASCSATSVPVSVTINPQPAATISPSGTVDICSTGSVVLTASSGAGYLYQWKKGSADIPGATLISYTATTTGNYKVVVTNSVGCTKASSATKVIKTCKEEAFISKETIVSIYPNPANDFILLSSGSDPADVLMLSADGREMKEIKNATGTTQLDISDLAQGIYFIRVSFTGKESETVKFIKE